MQLYLTMSEGRKRCRKSKLEVRDDDCDYELVTSVKNEDTPILQIHSKLLKLPKLEHPPVFDHDYCRPGYQTYFPIINVPSSAVIAVQPIQPANPLLSVNVKVEPLNEDSKDNKKPVFTEKKPISLLKKMQPISSIMKNRQNSTIKMCKYDPEKLLSVSEEIARKSSNPADKMLDIEMRNLWGNVLHTPVVVGPHEGLLQKALETWQAWYNTSRMVRDNPLFYQCHICHIAWWRLQPFREHIRTHSLTTLKVTLKENVHECMIIASDRDVSKLIYIDIDGDCWKCGKNLDFHKELSQAYTCTRCKRSLYTCAALSEHESTCMYSNIAKFNIAIERQCIVCKRFMNSLPEVHEHMILAHTVRSDVPVPVTFKQCINCKCKYFRFSSHNCAKSPKNSSCDHCCRKFATKPLASAHVLSQYNRGFLCRICAMPIQAKCMEMEHLMTHSENYQMVYKCTVCSNQYILFVDEVSIRMHKHLWHQKKSDRRRSFHELLLVPKHCVETGGVEEAFQNGTEFDQPSQKKKETKHDDEDFFIQAVSSAPLRMMTADVDVTVDQVDIKREPVEFTENGDIDYEELLNNMFNGSYESISKKPNTKAAEKTEQLGTVKIKTEPIDDIDITENPVEIVKIKTEPVDEDYRETTEPIGNIDVAENLVATVKIKSEPADKDERENQSNNGIQHKNQVEIERKECASENQVEIERKECASENQVVVEKKGCASENQVDTLKVKVETDISIDDIETENIVIKNEIDDDISSEDIPFDQLITDLNTMNGDMDWVSEEVLNPDEMSFDVMNPSGLYKKKRVYACHKCGYTAQHKQYKIHVTSKCSMSPGINSSHPCTKCGLTFVMFRNYVLHFDTHGYEVMSCPKCSMVFDTLVKLLSHVQKHIKANFVGIHVLNKGGEESTKAKKQVKCHECHSVILQADMFPHWEAHLTLKEPSTMPAPVKEEAPELTVDCERVTMNNKTLDPAALKMATDHLQSALSTEKECVICYRAFARRYDVKRHVVEHLLMDAHMNKAKNKAFRCQICGSDHQTPEQYKYHMREHGSMPIFKCELCDKTFSDSSNFAKHKKTHNVRVLICDICSKKFHSRAALLKHITDHSRLGLTQCEFCDATFVCKQAYKRHKYQVHVKNKFKCVLCDLSFTSLQKKWDHNWEIHKERKQKADCPICLKSFRKFQDVRVHARSEHRADVTQAKQPRGGDLPATSKPARRIAATYPTVKKEGKRKTECPICLKSFINFQVLRVHARSEHNTEVAKVKHLRRRDIQMYHVLDLKQEPSEQQAESSQDAASQAVAAQ